jgi:hypothetical protein
MVSMEDVLQVVRFLWVKVSFIALFKSLLF